MLNFLGYTDTSEIMHVVWVLGSRGLGFAFWDFPFSRWLFSKFHGFRIVYYIYYRTLSLRTSNRHADNVITNCMFRLSLQRKYAKQTTSFDRQNARVADTMKKSPISQASSHLALGHNTIMPFSMLEVYRKSATQHMRRIADYLEMGEGVWYTIEGNNIVFRDGAADPETQSPGPYLTSFR